MRILFHVDEVDKWNLTLENVNNILKEEKISDEKFKVTILANSFSVINLKKEIAINLNLYNQLEKLNENGVQIIACNNSLNRFKIPQEEICSFVKTVPSGVVEIAKKQTEGYCYIKA